MSGVNEWPAQVTSLSLSGNIETVILTDLFLAFMTCFKYSVNPCVQGNLCLATVTFIAFVQLGLWVCGQVMRRSGGKVATC